MRIVSLAPSVTKMLQAKGAKRLKAAGYTVLHLDPRLLPLVPEATEKDYAQRERHRGVILERLQQRPGWDSLRTVRAGRFFFCCGKVWDSEIENKESFATK